MKNLFTNLMDFFFPPVCPLCKRIISSSKIICENCFEGIARLIVKEPICLKCGKTNTHRHVCRKTFLFDEIIPIFHYREKIARLIHLYKYKRKEKLSGIFINFLISRIQNLKSEYDFVISVPLHPARKRERGFDQNEKFCIRISKSLGIPYLKNSAHRIKYTRPQVGLKEEKRRENIRGVFRVYGNFENKNILLFDDVVTTGATLNELSILLKEKGVKKITVLTLAIA